MRLPSGSVLKYSVVGLTLAALAGVYLLATREGPASLAHKARTEEAPARRGDDPTYAEELKKMAAMLQDMRYRFDQTENQRLLDRDRAAAQARESAQKATAQAQQEIERLNAALREAQKTLDDKIEKAADAPVVASLKGEVERLKTEQAALRQQLADGRKAAEAEAEAAARRPEANRVLAPPAPPAAEARPNDAAPGPVQLAPGALDQLRAIPGLESFSDRLSGMVAAGEREGGARGARAGSKSVAGLKDDYVTLAAYGTGAGGTRARSPGAGGREAASLEPRRYPFTVKPGKDGATAVIPVYTIPDAATLVQNSTMTPLVGRVPFRGKLTDPFRFKLITGATNLASNGHRIPGVADAVWTGYAVGVREQSCVRAYIDTVTFTFEDGRIHTVHRGKGTAQAAGSVNETLGYLTDPWGKPCIRGRYFNNAGSYLKDRGMAAFLDGLANAYAQAQVTTQRDYGGSLSSFVSGNTYEYALGKGLGGTAGEIADYVAERAEGAFDVIYVPPGIDVQIFVETQIPIDYDTGGRKLSYGYGSGVSHDLLD
ncbi:MAG: TIGR03752 family integrating conjugative element protein [bacterium]|nr:TIGR03752 family integrating conjugative element protein [bacterium]